MWAVTPDTAVLASVRETPALTLSASLTVTLPKLAGRMAKLSVEQATIVGAPVAGYVMRMRALGQALGSTIPAYVLRPASPAANVSLPLLRIRPLAPQLSLADASTSSSFTVPSKAVSTASPPLLSATTARLNAPADTLVWITPLALPAGVPVSNALNPAGAITVPMLHGRFWLITWLSCAAFIAPLYTPTSSGGPRGRGRGPGAGGAGGAP